MAHFLAHPADEFLHPSESRAVIGCYIWILNNSCMVNFLLRVSWWLWWLKAVKECPYPPSALINPWNLHLRLGLRSCSFLTVTMLWVEYILKTVATKRKLRFCCQATECPYHAATVFKSHHPCIQLQRLSLFISLRDYHIMHTKHL